jgi:hypothetical protein
MRAWAIDTGHGDCITTGLDENAARRIAQSEADTRGESVFIYQDPSNEDEEAEEITPRRRSR